MPPSSSTSPRFPHYRGFQTLSSSNNNSSGDISISRRSSRSSMEREGVGIPLSQIRSNASFGARRVNQGGVGPEIERMRSSGRDIPGTAGGSSSADEKNDLVGRARNVPIGRRRARNGEPLTRSSTDSVVALTFMGRLYTRIISASVVTRYLVYVVPVAIILAIPIVVLPLTGNSNAVPLGSVTVNATADPPVKELGPPLLHLFIWLEASWFGLWVGKIVAHLLPVIFVFFCGVISSGTRKYAKVLRGMEIPFSLFAWALVSWLVFRFLFSNNNIGWIHAVTNILGSLFVSSAIFLAERGLVHLMSISYHQRSFANRIKDSKRDIYLLGLLYDASRALFPMYCPEFVDEDYVINDSIEARLGRGGLGKSVPGAATPMRLIGNVGRFGDKVTSVFGNLASEITGKQVFNPGSAHNIVVEALEKSRSSEALARRIWMSFVVEDNDSLYLADVEEVLGPAHKDEAREAFMAIDADMNGDISLDEMIRKVVAIGKERKAMANSMKDISEALGAFDKVLLFIVLLLVIFVFLAFFQSSFITTLATAGTALLSLSFVFAVTTQEFLGSCIFLFVKHPYDVGDRVEIQGKATDSLIVEKISLLYTVFVRIDRMQVVQMPNIILNTQWIENVTRSKAMCETIDVNIAYGTSFEDVELLRLEMETFVRHPDNSRDFQPDITIGVAGVGDCDKLQLQITVKHKSNWHDERVRATRRSKFMCALALALKKIPIAGPGGGGDPAGGPLNPTYSVSVTDEFAAAARAKSAADKNKARLVPVVSGDDKDDDKDGTAVEQQAVRELNTMPPVLPTPDAYRGGNDPFAEPRDLYGGSVSPVQARAEAAEAATAASAGVEAVRNELLKSQSMKGRRQAGQGLPPMSLGEDSPPPETTNAEQYAEMAPARRGVRSFDVERGSADVRPSYEARDFQRQAGPPPPPPSGGGRSGTNNTTNTSNTFGGRGLPR